MDDISSLKKKIEGSPDCLLLIAPRFPDPGDSKATSSTGALQDLGRDGNLMVEAIFLWKPIVFTVVTPGGKQLDIAGINC